MERGPSCEPSVSREYPMTQSTNLGSPVTMPAAMPVREGGAILAPQMVQLSQALQAQSVVLPEESFFPACLWRSSLETRGTPSTP